MGDYAPCPFCGATDSSTFGESDEAERASVHCDGCGAYGPKCEGSEFVQVCEEARLAWNKRAALAEKGAPGGA